MNLFISLENLISDSFNFSTIGAWFSHAASIDAVGCPAKAVPHHSSARRAVYGTGAVVASGPISMSLKVELTFHPFGDPRQVWGHLPGKIFHALGVHHRDNHHLEFLLIWKPELKFTTDYWSKSYHPDVAYRHDSLKIVFLIEVNAKNSLLKKKYSLDIIKIQIQITYKTYIQMSYCWDMCMLLLLLRKFVQRSSQCFVFTVKLVANLKCELGFEPSASNAIDKKVRDHVFYKSSSGFL